MSSYKHREVIPLNFDNQATLHYIELQNKRLEWDMFCDKVIGYTVLGGIGLFIAILLLQCLIQKSE